MTVDLSAIVITRNEQAHIEACLEGCLGTIRRALKEQIIQTFEVVLSDSASTDRTVEIARRFPIKIVQLHPDWPRSPGAGRYVGLRHVEGSLILFVDGDYVLDEGWLPQAIRALVEHPEIAAVCGMDVEGTRGDSTLLRYQRKLTAALAGEPEAVPVGLYRRSTLNQVGGVHPFLKGAEDRDLAYRLRAAGYRLVRLPQTMGVHRWSDNGALSYMTYFRSVLAWSIGDGQVFRVRRSMPLVSHDVRRRYLNIRYLNNYLTALVLAALALLGIAVAANPTVWPILLVLLASGLAADFGRRARGQSWREAMFGLHVVPYSIIRHAGFVIGVLTKVPVPSLYPQGELIIQSAHEISVAQQWSH